LVLFKRWLAAEGRACGGGRWTAPGAAPLAALVRPRLEAAPRSPPARARTTRCPG